MRHAETCVTVPVVSRAKPPISNKLLGTATVKFPSRLQGETGGSIMQHLFAVPWLTPSRRTLRGIAVVAILGFGFFAILKSTSGGREAPAKELVTGSIPRAASVPKPPPNDPMAAFLSPA